MTNEIVVHISPTYINEAKNLALDYGLTVLDQYKNLFLFGTQNQKSRKNKIDITSSMAARVHKIAQQLSQDKKIDSAHANYLHQPSSKIPSNDPKIIQEWYLGGKFKQCDSAGLCKTIIGANVLKSWEITKGNPADVLAIIDSGFIWPNELDLPSGVLSCPSRQYDFAGNLYSKDPQDNHGFLVGSLLGACSNNEYGAASPNWYSKLLMYGHDRNELDAFTIFRSYKKLLEFDPPPQILNTSFGDTYYALETKKEVATLNKDLENFFLTYLDYASKFKQKNIIWVAAAGNYSISSSDIYPGALPSVINVGSTNMLGQLSHFSNFGKNIDILAPGEDIPVMFKQKIILVRGTSFSAPIVSSIISLIKSVYPKDGSWNWKVARYLLQSTAVPRPCKSLCPKNMMGDQSLCKSIWCSNHFTPPGIIDATSAVKAAQKGLPALPFIDSKKYHYSLKSSPKQHLKTTEGYSSIITIPIKNVGGKIGMVQVPCLNNFEFKCQPDDTNCYESYDNKTCLNLKISPNDETSFQVHKSQENNGTVNLALTKKIELTTAFDPNTNFSDSLDIYFSFEKNQPQFEILNQEQHCSHKVCNISLENTPLICSQETESCINKSGSVYDCGEASTCISNSELTLKCDFVDDKCENYAGGITFCEANICIASDTNGLHCQNKLRKKQPHMCQNLAGDLPGGCSAEICRSNSTKILFCSNETKICENAGGPTSFENF